MHAATDAVETPPTLARGVTIVLVVSVFASTNGIFARFAYDAGADVLAVLASRGLGALVLALGVFALARPRLPTRRELPAIALLGVVLSTNAFTYFGAVRYISPALATIIVFVFPALVVVGSALLGWTRLTLLTVVGIVFALAGVVALVGLPEDRVDPLGLALSLGGAVSAAVYLLLAQVTLRKSGPLGVFAVAGTASAVVLVVSAALFGGADLPDDDGGWLALAGIGVLGTAVAHTLLFRGIQLLGSARAAMIAPFEVVVTVAGSAVLLAEPVTWTSLLGGGLVVVGAILIPAVTARRAPRPG